MALKRNLKRTLVAGAAIAIAVVALVIAFGRDGQTTTSTYRTAKVDRGDITVAVSASGTLSPVITVQVGSQVSGQISELRVDFNSEVKAGQLLARIDPQTFVAKVLQAEAELAVAKAAVLTQRATAERMRAEADNARAMLGASEQQIRRIESQLGDASREKQRKTSSAGRNVFTQRDIDQAVSTADQADAAVRTAKSQMDAQKAMVLSSEAQFRAAEAGVENARAQVKQREAALQQAVIDLERTYIRAPIDGTVIGRNIDTGQTVAASLQAPVLFQLAQDLRDMQVLANIDEADIGRASLNQRVTFTVDAFPNRTFAGEVVQIRKAPQIVSNVVSYVTVISAANTDLKLLPGMTASVRIVADERRDVVRVPNAALRFRPPGSSADSTEPKSSGEGGGSGGQPQGGGGRFPSPQELAERLAVGLSLTVEQKAQTLRIFEESRNKMGAARQSGSEEEFAKARQQARSETRQKIVALLTPEQRSAYERFLARNEGTESRPGRVWVIGSGGKPEPVSITIGAGDAQVTEVVGGNLKPGQEVIIGQASAERPSVPRQTGPRLGF